MTKKHAEKKQPEAAAYGESPAVPDTQAPQPPVPASEELEQLKAQAAKAAEHWDKLLRTTADFDNFKKRAARERHEAVAYANAALLQKIIPVLDNFEIALTATASATDAATQSMQAGVKMIASQLRAALADAGLEEIDATGKAFDPNFHEAVSQQDSNEVPEGQVLQQLRKGYKLKDRLLRPATVIVARKPSPAIEPA